MYIHIYMCIFIYMYVYIMNPRKLCAASELGRTQVSFKGLFSCK